ncbi:hypothetical protein FA10DRAFT_152959 [Acaromyces ingoldii]|uniref:Uncharacterized protein n=1 Tax=Acaromyces ingoldii TaxID=215250 RepID=A0A316YIX3_9BASI|nr:hypothetical protein FA10DRAFT_152959 [Acaromyces ingoldii]PWN88043.1 hypothetical protein FA10DRAFT_152959 [Acaromyces ingoldii]
MTKADLVLFLANFLYFFPFGRRKRTIHARPSAPLVLSATTPFLRFSFPIVQAEPLETTVRENKVQVLSHTGLVWSRVQVTFRTETQRDVHAHDCIEH